MKPNAESPESIFQELGKVYWTKFDAFAVETKLGAKFLLSPNRDHGVPTVVHIDEIKVPDLLRRRGVAAHAMSELCLLADKYQFRLDAGPIGWTEHPWRDKFVEWVLSFGFLPDKNFESMPLDDPSAFNVCRKPQGLGA